MSSRTDGFFAAPFVIDGESEGVGFWSKEQLSNKWMRVCRDLIDNLGEAHDHAWGAQLSHVRTRFVSSSGAALLTLYLREHVAVSLALLRGESPQVERDVLQMFADSLRNVHLVQQAAKSATPFSAMFELTERPLAIVVPWPDPDLSDEDAEIAQELSIHFAGAFLLGGVP